MWYNRSINHETVTLRQGIGMIVCLAVFLPYPLLLVRRIRSEERLLEAELAGYTAYKQRVRWRLIPFLW